MHLILFSQQPFRKRVAGYFHVITYSHAVSLRKVAFKQRPHRSPVRLNRLVMQKLSSCSAAILRGHRVLGTMGQCMLGYIGHSPAALTFTRFCASCCQGELAAVWQQPSPFVLVLSVRNVVNVSPIFKFSYSKLLTLYFIRLHMYDSFGKYDSFVYLLIMRIF